MMMSFASRRMRFRISPVMVPTPGPYSTSDVGACPVDGLEHCFDEEA